MNKGGYLYLFERISRKSVKAYLTRQREIKIGISKEPIRRLKEVDAALPGRVVKIYQQWYDNPRQIETKLHKKFESSNFKPKAVKPGGGLTEWFLINKVEYQQLKDELSITRGWFEIAFYIGFILIILFGIFVYLKTIL